jgi:hypothetical protein
MYPKTQRCPKRHELRSLELDQPDSAHESLVVGHSADIQCRSHHFPIADKPGGVIAAHGHRYRLFVDGAIQLLF